MFLMTPSILRRPLLLGISLLALCSGAAAHEFWIQPSTFRPAPDAPLKVHLLVGTGFPGDPVARDPSRIVKFSAFGPSGEQPVAGRDGMDPAGMTRLTTPGLYTLAYQSSPASVTLEADKFEAYLTEEGLEHVIKARAESGRSGAEARENYSRCCKSLVTVGDGGAEGFDRTLGLPLELTALDDPRDAAPTDQVRFRVDYQGQPIEGLLVKARHRDHPAEVLTARSAPDGAVTFSLPHDGMWLVTTVHMAKAPEGSGADWESRWASLTFEVAAPPAPRATP